MNNRQQLHPAIQARIDFFNTLEEEVKKASIGNELRILYEKYGNYCINLGIGNAFGGHAFPNDICDENFRIELLSNIDMARSVCLSKRDGLSSGSQLTINNTNHQEQNQKLSFQINEALRKALTGEQYDEIIDLINKKADKPTIIEKLSGFGVNVLSGILATILGKQIGL